MRLATLALLSILLLMPPPLHGGARRSRSLRCTSGPRCATSRPPRRRRSRRAPTSSRWPPWRLRRDSLLDNPVRARLYERIRAEPGIHRAELVDFSGIGEGATRHHLTQLVDNRLLVELEQDGYVRYYAAGEVPPEVARREGILRAGSHRAVYELCATEPTLNLREAAARLKMSAPSVHRAKKKLTAAWLLPVAGERVADLVAEA